MTNKNSHKGKIIGVCAEMVCALALIISLIFCLIYSERMVGGLEISNANSFVESKYFERLFYNDASNFSRFLKNCERFETDGEYDGNILVDIKEYAVKNNRITNENINGVVYRLKDLVKWSQEGYTYYYEEYTIAFAGDGEYDVDYSYDEEYEYMVINELYAPVGYDSLRQFVEENPEESIQQWMEYLRIVLEDLPNKVWEYRNQKEQYRSENTNFIYRATNLNTKEIYQNITISKSEAQNSEAYIIMNMKNYTQENSLNYSNTWIMDLMDNLTYNLGDEYEIIFTVNTDFPVQDEYVNAKNSFEKWQPWIPFIMGVLVLSGIGIVASLIYLTAVAGRRKEDDQIHLHPIDSVKTELAATAYILLLGSCLALAIDQSYNISMNAATVRNDEVYIFIAGLVLFIANAIGLTAYLSLVRRIKAKTLWSNSILGSCIHVIKKAGRTVARTIQGIKITNKILLLFMGYLLINYILLLSGGFAMIMDLVFNAAVGYWLLKDALGRHRILEGTIKMSRGDLEYKINTAELKNDNLDLAIAVNHIGDGLQQAIDKSMKDERMKTELITNVSHDIKTPLTSIINYVDLIKRENIEDPKIKSYIEILDMKSQRLKNLTEDLVEASKVSSGNIELEFIKINFNELIMQTNGEFSEKFAQRRLELITNIPEEPAVIYADGRRIWRIIENLYNNVAKYAMEGTRVYVDVRIAQGNMYFSVKNISEQPLNINASELTERFIRGDVSRSTEGSGLGLSIAKNLTTLQNGKFDIYLDGDLFKVVIVFPLFRGERLSPDKQAESGNNQDKVPETENAAEDKLPDGSKRIHLKKKFKRKKNSVRQIPVETIDFSADSKPAEPEVSLELPKLEEINEQIDKLTLDNEKEK